MPIAIWTPAATHPWKESLTTSTGNTLGQGGVGNGWNVGSNIIDGAYCTAFPYGIHKSRGWRLQVRLYCSDITSTGKYPIARFLANSGAETTAQVQEASGNDAGSRSLTHGTWTSAWATFALASTGTISVKYQMAREHGGIGYTITVYAAQLQFQWINP